MFVPRGRMAPHTFRYGVRKQRGKGVRGRNPKKGWAKLMYKCDDGLWRKVKRYKKLDDAYKALIKKLGYGFILESV